MGFKDAVAWVVFVGVFIGLLAIGACKAKYVYHDWRCMFVECRIMK